MLLSSRLVTKTMFLSCHQIGFFSNWKFKGKRVEFQGKTDHVTEIL